MSSDLQSAIASLLLNNYVSVAMVTVVAYDYILTLPSEIEHVWSKPWTGVSTLFVLVRYLGIYSAMITSFVGTTFVPGPAKTSFQGSGILLSSDWAFAVFISAADLVMLLRVYAMWNRSKIILRTLLFFYVAEVIIQVVCTAIFDRSKYITMVIVQVLNYSICYATFTAALSPFLQYTIINPFAFDALLLVLALIPTTKQSIAMYKATKQWQPNRYMALIVREGILYIFLVLLHHVAGIVQQATTNQWILALGFICIISLFPVVPRLILSIRELYEKDSRGRFQGVDSGFGVRSRVFSGQGEVVSAIAFADAGRDQAAEGEGEIQLEPV